MTPSGHVPRLAALCLALLASSSGFAQTSQEETPSTPPGTGAAHSPPLVPADSPPPEAPAPQGELIPHEPSANDASSDRGTLRLIATPWAASVGALATGVLAAIPGYLLISPFCGVNLQNQPACAITLFSIISLGVTSGAALGAWRIGGHLDGRGTFLPTFLGALAGSVLGAAGGLGSSNEAVLIIGLATGPIIGAVVGYEISHRWILSEEQAPQAATGFRVMPVLAAIRGGGLLAGLAGRF
jgi:hypothetical protein